LERELPVIYIRLSSVSYGYKKMTNISWIPKFELSYLTSNFNAVFFFLQNLLLMDEKGSKKGRHFEYVEGIFNTWISKKKGQNTIDPTHYCVKHNTVSTLNFNMHLFSSRHVVVISFLALCSPLLIICEVIAYVWLSIVYLYLINIREYLRDNLEKLST
jgi:hypothetical protein